MRQKQIGGVKQRKVVTTRQHLSLTRVKYFARENRSMIEQRTRTRELVRRTVRRLNAFHACCVYMPGHFASKRSLNSFDIDDDEVPTSYF
jgi:hypothetical protein